MKQKPIVMGLRQIAMGLAVAAVLLLFAAGLRYARSADLVSDEFARRAIQVAIGLMLAAYANVMPKENGQWPSSPRAAAVSLAVRRVGGWSLGLAGLGYAALWALAPLPVANVASVVVLVAAMLVTVGYAARAFVLCRRTQRSSTVPV